MNFWKSLAALCLMGIPCAASASEADDATAAILRLADGNSQEEARKGAVSEGERVMNVFPRNFGVREVAQGASGRLRIVLEGDFGPAPRHRGSDEERASAGLREELLLESIEGALLAAEVESPHEVLVPDGDDGLRPLGDVSTPEERAERKAEARRGKELRRAAGEGRSAAPTRSARLPKGGALLGKRIALSPGHGWVKDGSWSYQRGLCQGPDKSLRGIHEDLSNNELVAWWIMPLLENMGAELILARETDHADDGYVIMNDGDSGYSESAGSWADGTSAGGWKSDYRTSASADAKASFMHTFSTSGWRNMSAWFLNGTNRTSKATFTLKHAGGSTPLDVDQTKAGKFFLELGKAWCAAGVPCGVEISNAAGSGVLIADGVKMGGGPYAYSGSSTKPFWHMAALHYLGDVMGKSPLVNDVQARPRFAEMIGADAFLSVHSNAAGSNCTEGATAHGIATYRFNCSGASNEGNSSCDDPGGSKKLSSALHNAVLGRIRADWDENFCNRGEKMSNLGEVRELDDTPGVLIEVAFHDNLKTPQKCTGSGTPRMTDNKSMQDPRWREALAYGFADGFASFFGTGKAPPRRPASIKAVNGASPCSLTVSWKPVADATAYRLYMVSDVRPGYERAFDAGTIVEGTSATLTNLKPGKVYVFRVAAVDKNGEGFPSTAVAARVLAAGEKVEGLYVNGYDRRDSWIQEIDNDLAYAGDHAVALSAVGDDFYFDGATSDLVEDGSVSLNGYAVVDYQAGRNSSDHGSTAVSLSPAMQTKLGGYLSSGGKLFISGDDVAFDLGSAGLGTQFLSSSLKAGFSNTDAASKSLSGTGPFAGLSGIAVDDGKHGTYEEKSPDALTAASGGKAVMTYDGTSHVAAVEGPNSILLGVPLETIYPASSRAKVAACGIGRLLKGSSWTCAPSSISASASGAKEGECTLPEPPPPTDAGTPEQDAGQADAGQADAGTPHPDGGDVPVPTDSGTPEQDAGSGQDDASSPDEPDEPLPSDEDAGHPIDPLAGGDFTINASSCGCTSQDGSAAPWAALLSVLSMAWFGRRRSFF